MRVLFALFFSLILLIGQAGFNCAYSAGTDESCCCAHQYDCATLEGTCCDVSRQEKPFTLSIKVDVPAEPQVLQALPVFSGQPSFTYSQTVSRTSALHLASTKLYLKNRSLLI